MTRIALTGFLLSVLLFPVTAIQAKAEGLTVVAFNQHKYMLKFDFLTFEKGNWQGDANFSFSQCLEKKCFHLSGTVHFPQGNDEAAFPVPGTGCLLHFKAVSSMGMDGGDYSVTLISRTPDAKGCASLPANLPGFYKQEPSLSGKSHT